MESSNTNTAISRDAKTARARSAPRYCREEAAVFLFERSGSSTARDPRRCRESAEILSDDCCSGPQSVRIQEIETPQPLLQAAANPLNRTVRLPRFVGQRSQKTDPPPCRQPAVTDRRRETNALALSAISSAFAVVRREFAETGGFSNRLS